MVKNNTTTPSVLEKFPISFEYDMSWHDAKKAVRIRTHDQ